MSGFWQWWRYLPERIDPVIFQIGSFRLQWYGLMYVLAFVTVQALVIHRIRREPDFEVTEEQVGALSVALMAGLLIGARLGYVLFYNLPYYLHHPAEIVLPFRREPGGWVFTGISGMSYHGGLIGAVAGGWLYIRRTGLGFMAMADLYIPAIPLGYTFGRLGNFINGELYGRVTDSRIGMIFPLSPEGLPRHPSQLYEAVFEGLFLFAVLWGLRRRSLPRGAMLGLYLIGYGTVRFFIEFFRQPDPQLGFVVLSFSMGQLLCAAMILAGMGLLIHLFRRQGG